MDDLRAIRRLSPEEVQRQSVRARYGAGRIGERRIPAYVDEEGVDPDRGTETFAPHEFFSAYERHFLDLLEGNTTLFVRARRRYRRDQGPAPQGDAGSPL